MSEHTAAPETPATPIMPTGDRNDEIQIYDLHKSFGDLEVLKGISLTVHRGEVVCVIGPSGSGKSTLLRCVNLLEQPTKGKVYILNEEITDPDADIDRLRTTMGMVFQQFNLFPHLTAMQNCTIALVRVLGKPREEARAIAQANLEKVGLGDRGASFPAQMSGGQQQRVAIARAVVGARRLILADEPTGALDTETGEGVLRLMREFCDEGAAGILVTHEARHAAWADRVVFLRDGRVVDDVAPLAHTGLDESTGAAR